MRLASEHPRIAATIAVGLIILGPASVAAGSALGGVPPAHTSERAIRVANSQLIGLHRQLQAAHAQDAELRGQVTTLTAQVAQLRQTRQRPASTPHTRRKSAKP